MDTQQEKQISNVNANSAEQVSVGKTLRAAREQMGLSVNDVANRIKFAPRQIESLEDDDFGQLHEAAFVRGFVRSYARLLELDPVKLLAGLPSSHAKTSSTQEVKSVEIPMPTSLSARRYNIILLAAGLVIALSVAIFERMQDSVPEQAEPAAKTTVQTLELPNVTAEGQSDRQPEQAQAPAPQAAARSATPPAPRQPLPQTPVRAAPATAFQQPMSQSAVHAAPAQALRQLVPQSPVRAAPAPLFQQAVPQSAVHATPFPALKQPAPVEAVRSAPVPLSSQPAPQGAVQPAPDGAPAVSAGVSATEHAVRMEFDEDAWVEVKDGTDKILISRMHTAGSLVRVTGKGPMLLVIGNSQAVRVFDNGKQIKPGRPNSSGVARITLN